MWFLNFSFFSVKPKLPFAGIGNKHSIFTSINPTMHLHQGAFNNYVDIILPFFDDLPTWTWTVFTQRVYKISIFGTTYPTHLVHVVIERPSYAIESRSRLLSDGKIVKKTVINCSSFQCYNRVTFLQKKHSYHSIYVTIFQSLFVCLSIKTVG